MSEHPQISRELQELMQQTLDRLMQEISAETGAIVIGKVDDQQRFLSTAAVTVPSKYVPHMQSGFSHLSQKLPELVNARAAEISQLN